MKNHIKFQHRHYITSLFLIIFFISGCTHLYNQPLHEINLMPVNDKINLSVGLVMTDEFRNVKWEKKEIGDTFILPIGENLAHQTEQLMKRVFANSVVLEGVNPTQNTEIKYIMTPKVIFVEQSLGATAFSNAILSIIVEWKLTDPKGKAVWQETVKGVGTGQTGNIVTGGANMEKRFKMALQDLFEKTQEAILSSDSLRNIT
ncbi:MAG: hypothetical protein KKC46_17080 [Proteobacteria bacterium]|nr:hypothetical protein [Pseudomonadota bacterium]